MDVVVQLGLIKIGFHGLVGDSDRPKYYIWIFWLIAKCLQLFKGARKIFKFKGTRMCLQLFKGARVTDRIGIYTV